jgi:hypothetical protein
MARAKADDQTPENPLGFLDRLLEEERHSNLHFGDVRFWRHLEYIDTAQIYRTKSLEYRTMKLMFCEAIFYFVFLFVLTGFIVQQRSSSLYDAREHELAFWSGCRRTSTGQSCQTDAVKDTDSLQDWLREQFVPKTFQEFNVYPSVVNASSVFRLQDGTMAWSPRYAGDTKTSVIIGAVRLRQLRVQYNRDCLIKQLYIDEGIQTDCFPKFSEDVQSKTTWAPRWTPEYLAPQFQWYPSDFTQQSTMVGYHGVYPGDGFYLDVALNLTQAQERMQELKEWQWLDKRTRAFVVEVSTLNPNVNVFVHNRILFEFPNTGGVVVLREAFAFRTLVLSLELMATDDFWGVFCYFSLTCGMQLLLFTYVAWLLWKNGIGFFQHFWSICDLIILTLFLVLLGIYVNVFTDAGTEPNLQPENIADPEMFFPAGRLVPSLELAERVLSGLGLLSWLRILKYLSLIDMFHPFVRVVERCIYNLLLFACLLFVVMTGFAVAFYTAYGGEMDLFATLGGSFIAVMVASAGGVDLDPIFAYDDLLGPILVFIYIIMIALLLLNTFMAIVVDTYSVCCFLMSEVVKGRRSSPAAVFLWTYFNALKGVRLVGKELEEDKGNEDEQEVPLTALPEALSQRYLETRSQMRALLDNAEEKMQQEKIARLEEAGVLQDVNVVTRYRTHSLLTVDSGTLPQQENKNDNNEGALAIADASPTARSMMPYQQFPTDIMDEDGRVIMVNRVQLQRMLEDDDVLCDICGTDRAIDVVRRFRVDYTGVDPFEAVANLQASVAQKLQELEEQGMHLTFDEMQTLRTVSQELHSALTEAQKEWRAELLSVLQMSSLLSVALIELTKKMERVQLNHNALSAKVGGS